MDAQYQVAAFYANQKVWGISIWFSCGADGRPGGWTVWHFLTFSGGLVRQNLKEGHKTKGCGWVDGDSKHDWFDKIAK